MRRGWCRRGWAGRRADAYMQKGSSFGPARRWSWSANPVGAVNVAWFGSRTVMIAGGRVDGVARVHRDGPDRVPPGRVEIDAAEDPAVAQREGHGAGGEAGGRGRGDRDAHRRLAGRLERTVGGDLDVDVDPLAAIELDDDVALGARHERRRTAVTGGTAERSDLDVAGRRVTRGQGGGGHVAGRGAVRVAQREAGGGGRWIQEATGSGRSLAGCGRGRRGGDGGRRRRYRSPGRRPRRPSGHTRRRWCSGPGRRSGPAKRHAAGGSWRPDATGGCPVSPFRASQ